MRNIVIVYCLLTLVFSGGCVLVLLAMGARGDLLSTLPSAMVTLAAVANGVFLWMAMARAPGAAMVAGGILYAVLQCGLALKAGLWSTLGPASVIILALFVIKGATLVFAGREAR